TAPTTGEVTVLGGIGAGSPDALERVAFVAQETPLYRHITVRAMLTVAANMNQHFDRHLAEGRLATLDIPLDRRIGRLSGGQQAQLALALALARRPDLLVLDEPLARLDPLARHEVMAVVMSAVAEEGLSVIFSSHVVSELERVADYLILVNHGRVQMMGVIEYLLATHVVLSGPTEQALSVAEHFDVVQSQHAGRQTQFVARIDASVEFPKDWVAENISLDELVLAYLREPSATAMSGPFAVSANRAGR
ncbi:MAG TPA: ATP-binding cassette domain-containing protein, partial [Acidimicrobiales bacterium]|nr:ATP-binding cassette domain-containing protein [Acidimicrobiales bacterium]